MSKGLRLQAPMLFPSSAKKWSYCSAIHAVGVLFPDLHWSLLHVYKIRRYFFARLVSCH